MFHQRNVKTRVCVRCRVRIQSLNCPRCSQLTEMAPNTSIPLPRRFHGEMLVPEATISRDLNESIGRKHKTLIRPVEDES